MENSNRPISLANEYRPKTFSEIIGQESIVRFFKNSLSNNRLRSVYLLPGLHGSGKTSVAKILARWINCDNRQGHEPCNTCKYCTASLRGQSLISMEVDGTSQNKADFVENDLMPFLQAVPPPGKYHVAIIDEFHRIKDPARSMFLPFLEFMDVERPRSIVILCTTEMQSIDKALCSRMVIPGTFQGLSTQQVSDRYASKLGVSRSVCDLILKVSGGSMRQFWNVYDSLRESSENQTIQEAEVLQWAGGVLDSEREKLWKAISNKNRKQLKDIWQQWMTSNKNGFDFVVTQLLEDLDDMIICNPDNDLYVDAHVKLSQALSFATHPLARTNQLVLGALYSMTLPGHINRVKPPEPETVSVPVEVPEPVINLVIPAPTTTTTTTESPSILGMSDDDQRKLMALWEDDDE